MFIVRLYTRRGCHLCDHTRADLEALRGEFSFTLQTIDIDSDEELSARFGCSIPVVTINNGQRVALRIDQTRLRRAFELAQQRAQNRA